MAAQIGEVRRYVTRHPAVGPCMAMATSVHFVRGALMTPTPVLLVRTLGAPPGVAGVLTAADGVGSPLGATLTPRLNSRFGSARALLVAPVVGAAPALLMPPAADGAGLVLFALGNAGFAPPPPLWGTRTALRAACALTAVAPVGAALLGGARPAAPTGRARRPGQGLTIRQYAHPSDSPSVLQSDSRTKRRPASSSRGSACA
ncbi:hypothetical protein ACFVUN_13785 [Kitasatospora griseola]|uniref:hypothetical protein n=1 Tax=Kitasatospora griseola TaxID=2064 RepID=UPI0036D81553